MSKASELGKQGEQIAMSHLQELGYEILELNWICDHLEIDIIAKDGNELVIVEVKTRGTASYEHPVEAVSNQKVRFLVNAAEAYIFEKNSLLETRFDVISIVFYGSGFQVEHYKNAFYAPIN